MFFRTALGLKQVSSAPTLRQRIEELGKGACGEAFGHAVLEESAFLDQLDHERA